MMEKMEKHPPDGYMSYLLGLLFIRMKKNDEACSALSEAVRLAPLNWDAWRNLAEVLTSKEMEHQLDLPSHWVKFFYRVHSSQRLEKNAECVSLVECLRTCGFARADFLNCEIASALLFMRQPDAALVYMMEVRDRDPFRTDSMDVLSNLLFVQELRVDLSHLARAVSSVNKFKPETQCVLGNLFSLRGEHERALMHFQRVLKLSPGHRFAWTVLGHEYMHMSNASSAIQCYRKAVGESARPIP
jgi:anaphase-promoting complex subunit 8